MELYVEEILKHRNQGIMIGIMIVLFLLLFLTVVLYIFFKRYNLILVSQSRLTSLENLVEKSNLLSTDIKIRDQNIDNILHNYLKILQKTIFLSRNSHILDQKSSTRIIKQIYEIVYGKDEFDWQTFYDISNYLFEDAFDKIRVAYPELDDIDFKICCLVYSGLSISDSSLILKLSENTIRTRRYHIRKKLGIIEYSNFVEELNKRIIKKVTQF